MNISTFQSTTGPLYEMRCDEIEVSTVGPPMKLDPEWEEWDSHGHAHSAVSDSYRYVATEEWVDEDGDDRDNGAYRCNACGDEVCPAHVVDYSTGWTPGTRRIMRGMTHYYRDGVEISQAEWDEAMRASDDER